MSSLFSEPHIDGDSNLSQIPCSWRVLHILTCFTGINNVFFMSSLPRCLRITSLVYHAAWLCISAPLIVLYISQIKWEASINSIAELVSIIIYNSYLVTLGTANMINALKANRTTAFLKKWYLLSSNKATSWKNIPSTRYRRVRASLIIICIGPMSFDAIVVVRHVLQAGWSVCETDMFPSFNTSQHLAKAMCVIYHSFGYISSVSVILSVCHFALVTLTLAEEFDKLYHVICDHLSSKCTGISAWEQVRFHHEALISLVCLHGQLSTMLLGLILVGNVVYVCFNLYYILAVHVGVLGVFSVIFAIATLLTIIVPSGNLENEVRIMFLHT